MIYLTPQRAQTLDGLLANAQSAAADIQQSQGGASTLLDYLRDARQMLADDMARGDALASVNVDTPAVTALRDDVRRWVDGPVADVRRLLNVAGSTRSQGDCVAELVVGRVIQIVYPDAATVDVPPVVVP